MLDNILLAMLGTPEIIIILVIVLLLFGKGMKEFKDASKGVDGETQTPEKKD